MALGKLEGAKMIQLFRHLVESRTIISMQIIGSEFERLTCVTEVVETDKQPQFIVDLPHAFKETADNYDPLKLKFNFNGPDQLEYIFDTQGGTYLKDGLQISLPEYVERLQRRRDFRIQTPIGTQLQFLSKKLKGTVDLINISLGGAYGVLRTTGFSSSKYPELKTKQPVFKVCIVFPGQLGETICIQKAEVVRVEQGKEDRKHKYAFEFKYMDSGEKQKLIEHIYRLQREYLQRR